VPDGRVGIETGPGSVLELDGFETAHQDHLVFVEVQVRPQIERVVFVSGEER
jgi:hypothetical protein